MTVKYPIWINKIEGAAQTPEEMNGLVEVLQNHADNISEQHKRIVATSGGIYPGKIIPTSNIPENLTQGAFIVSVPGTYSKFGNVTLPVADENNVYIGLIFWDGTTFSLDTIAIPKQDMQPVNDAIKRMDDFIRDFAVTTDLEFDSNSNNPIANSAVTPLAFTLKSFLKKEEFLNISTSDSKFGYIKNDNTHLEGVENKYITISNLQDYEQIYFNGYKAVSSAGNVNNFSTILAILDDNSVVSLLNMHPAATAQTVQEFTINLPNRVKSLKVGWSVYQMPVTNVPKIHLLKGNEIKEDSVKEYIDSKVDDFIRDFAVTTDLEFDSNSNNPIANSAVTPLADALEGFVGGSINIDTSIVNWSSNIYGMTNGIEASDYNKTLTIDVINYYKLKYRGVKWNSITTSELNEYKTIVGIDVNNDKIVLLDSVNSSTIPSVIDVDIDISNIKTIYIIKKNTNNTLPVISLESDKILKIKEFIELKTDDLNLILKSFLENNKHIIKTVNNINYGYLKVDGTYDLSDTFSKLIKNINTSDFDTLHFKGYKSLVSTSNVANYCSIIGYKSDNSKVVLLGSHNGSVAQSITDVEIDVSNYIRIDIAYSNYQVAIGYNPEISLYNKNYIQIEADSVKKNTLSSFKEINLGYVDLSRNIYNKELILNSNFEFTIQNIGNFGNINVFKLKGGSISFIGNFDYASNSATYNPDVFNVIYIYNEYDVVKIYIEN